MIEQQRKVYDFKSVGLTEEKRIERTNLDAPLAPIGIKTPMRLSNDYSQVFSMHTSIVAQIRDNFRNMLMTNHGERLFLYDFGANLTPLAFELGSEQIDTEALSRIRRTTEKYMPFIDLSTFEVINLPSEDGTLAKVVVRIGFGIPSLLVENQLVESIIYAAS